MNLDLHNLDDQPAEPWETDQGYNDDGLSDPDPDALALERNESEREQIERFIDLADQYDDDDAESIW